MATSPQELALAGYLAHARLLEARIVSVAKREQAGAYVLGRPGTGKSHTVATTLARLFPAGGFKVHNGHLTPRAVFDELRAAPEHVHVFDDVQTVRNNPQTLAIFLAALGQRAGSPRLVEWKTAGQDCCFHFVGGCVFIDNAALSKREQCQALASRLSTHVFDPSDEQLVAFLRDQAAQGAERLTPAEAGAVCEYVIAESARAERRIELRTYFKGLGDYRTCKYHEPGVDWRELVRASMETFFAEPIETGRAARNAEKRKLADEIVNELRLKGAKAEAEFKRRGGGSKATFHRFRQEVESR